jgi:hypothetical protein
MMVKIHYDLGDAKARQVFGDIADQRLSQNRQRGLCSIGSQRPEPFAVSGRENHCFHRLPILAVSVPVPALSEKVVIHHSISVRRPFGQHTNGTHPADTYG